MRGINKTTGKWWRMGEIKEPTKGKLKKLFTECSSDFDRNGKETEKLNRMIDKATDKLIKKMSPKMRIKYIG